MKESVLGIIIPSDREDNFNRMYDRLEEFGILQDQRFAPVFITRNPDTDMKPKVVISPKLSGVNAMWKMGLGFVLDKSDWVLFLNDDVEFHSSFLYSLWSNTINHGIGLSTVAMCPKTVKNLWTFDHDTLYYSIMKKREGWAFALRKSFILECPPIPDELEYFYGDDWYWFHSKRLGYDWVKLNNVIVRHEVGGTTKQDLARFRAIRKREHKIYKTLIQEYKNA